MTTTATNQLRMTASAHDLETLETLRTAETLLTAAIQHAREESLEPNWRDRLLGLRLRLEKTSVAVIERELDQMEATTRS